MVEKASAVNLRSEKNKSRWLLYKENRILSQIISMIKKTAF